MQENVTSVPNLSVLGDETNIAKKCTLLFRNFLATRKNQTKYFQVISLSYLTKQFSTDPTGFAAKTKEEYTQYLTRYFESVDVQAAAVPKDDGTYDLRLKVKVVENGLSIDWEKMIDFKSGDMKQLMEQLNGV